MSYTKQQKLILLFTILYVLGFGFYFLTNLNIEFLGYVGLIVAIFALLYGTLSKTNLPNHVLWGVSIWGLLHMMGGSVMTSDGVLYAKKIYPFFDGGGEFYILKFDQVVHAALYAVVALLFLHLLRRYYSLSGHHQLLVAFIAVMASLGVSAINEIVEFIVVITVPDNGVGGYYNTALDIVFNFVGAVVAVAAYYILRIFRR